MIHIISESAFNMKPTRMQRKWSVPGVPAECLRFDMAYTGSERIANHCSLMHAFFYIFSTDTFSRRPTLPTKFRSYPKRWKSQCRAIMTYLGFQGNWITPPELEMRAKSRSNFFNDTHGTKKLQTNNGSVPILRNSHFIKNVVYHTLRKLQESPPSAGHLCNLITFRDSTMQSCPFANPY